MSIYRANGKHCEPKSDGGDDMTGEPTDCLFDRLRWQAVISVVGDNGDENNADCNHNRKGQDIYNLRAFIVHLMEVSLFYNTLQKSPLAYVNG